MDTLRLRYENHKNVFTVEPNEARNHNYDYVLASGIFNVMFSSFSTWEEHVFKTLDELFQMSNLGYATNFLSSYSDESHRKENLYYSDPIRIMTYVLQKHSKNVTIIHDARLHDFSIQVHRT